MTTAALNPADWIDEYGDDLYRYALVRLRDGESAEEAVQETFVSALKHTDQYQARGTERAWLMGILKRKIIDLIRSRSRTVGGNEDTVRDPSEAWFDQSGSWRSEFRSEQGPPLDSLERADFWRIFRLCLDGLPARQADVFVLREMEEQNTETICKELEISPSNVWVILHRARLQLATCMQHRWQDQP